MKKQGFTWHPVIDEGKCIGCKRCVDTCGNDCLGFDAVRQVAIVRNPGECLPQFRTCEAACPVGAISFPAEEEYFTYVKNRIHWLETVFGPLGAGQDNMSSSDNRPPPPSLKKQVDKTRQ